MHIDYPIFTFIVDFWTKNLRYFCPYSIAHINKLNVWRLKLTTFSCNRKRWPKAKWNFWILLLGFFDFCCLIDMTTRIESCAMKAKRKRMTWQPKLSSITKWNLQDIKFWISSCVFVSTFVCNSEDEKWERETKTEVRCSKETRHEINWQSIECRRFETNFEYDAKILTKIGTILTGTHLQAC